MAKPVPIYLIARKARDSDGSLSVLMNGEKSYFDSIAEAESFFRETFSKSLSDSPSFELLKLWKVDDLPSSFTKS
jgi:hypothetical protein